MHDADRIEALLGRRPDRLTPLSGGDIARSLCAELDEGTRVMAKFARPGQPSLTLEARMLADLRKAGLPVPDTLAVADDLMLLAWIDPGQRGWDAHAEHAAGRAIATLHMQPVGAAFGHDYDTVIASLAQGNPSVADWSVFYGEHRLLARARSAHAIGRLPSALLTRIETLSDQLARWVPARVRPSLLHGDLWGGNMLPAADGEACFIDPAIYRGHGEVDLAMALLFNSVGEAFFEGYRTVAPVDPEFFRHRCTLYQLYPLLVHVELFGASYLDAVARALDRLEV
ncbi:fructosamine kinase family protein [Pseudoxanthomonas sp. JBR18]|uniref:fructosamine kinase family protein n=1 Tax=Pseudoxanthomonas sp. JBR18 TaxID=2969308 RepID=UPI0023059A93|nr:fructosamine kinase family protein [Pseudoxanthomonas sp. JBR18]WCE04391.1 fructosamine kinase family protein [Pseudoxanthomonas sp. JBR18]